MALHPVETITSPQQLSVFGPDPSTCVCSTVLSTIAVGTAVLMAQSLPSLSRAGWQLRCRTVVPWDASVCTSTSDSQCKSQELLSLEAGLRGDVFLGDLGAQVQAALRYGPSRGSP